MEILNYVSFVSCFFVPVIGVYIYTKWNGQICDFNFQTLFKYMVMVILNLPLTKVLISVVKKIVEIEVGMGSMKYLLFSILSVVILPILLQVFLKCIRVVPFRQ